MKGIKDIKFSHNKVYINFRKLPLGSKKNNQLKIIFNSCWYLESIKIWCDGKFFSERFVGGRQL